MDVGCGVAVGPSASSASLRDTSVPSLRQWLRVQRRQRSSSTTGPSGPARSGITCSGLPQQLSMDGFVVGTYHVGPTDDAAADSGKYVMCFARGDDGWRLVVDIWNATSSDSPDGSDEDDPRTRIIRAASTRTRYRFMTIDQRPTKSRAVEAHPRMLQRAKSRRIPRSSD